MKKIATLMPALLALTIFSMPAWSETNSPDNPNAGPPNADGGMPSLPSDASDNNGEPAQPVPDVAPDIDAIDPSLPSDCKTIDDELARLAKFAKNPKATQKQIAANQGRVTKLKQARVDAQCDDAEADQQQPAAATTTAKPAPATTTSK